MKTITDILEIFNSDNYLKNLIQNSDHVRRTYKPRKESRTSTGIAVDLFWGSSDGGLLIFYLELKHKVNTSSRLMRGKIKTALHLFVDELNKP